MKTWLMVLAITVAGNAWGTTFYIDYEGGDDARDGLTPATCWMHAPADRYAEDVSDDYRPAPGDTFIFKGGVHYRAYLNLTIAGEEGNPIVYKGDGWGAEKAVLDGSVPLTGWTRCASAADCGGNANWADIWYATTPVLPSGMRECPSLVVNLYQDDDMLSVAQKPELDDVFYMDAHSGYRTVSGLTNTTATDDWFASLGGDELVGGYAFVWRQPNEVDFRKITAFDGGTNTITFDELAGDVYTQSSRWHVAVANVLNDDVLDGPGEYVVDEENPVETGVYKVYLWPLNGTDPNTADISVSVQIKGFTLSKDYTTVEGFTVQKFTGTGLTQGYGIGKTSDISYATGIVVRNNDIIKLRQSFVYNALMLYGVDNSLVEGNYFNRNARMRGIVIKGANNVVRNNRIVKIGRTGISYEDGPGEITGNYLYGSTGVHGNALTTYTAHDILIKDNTVNRCGSPFTYQDCSNITLVNNVLHTDGGWVACCWNAGNSSNVTFYHNIFISGSGDYALYTQSGTISNWIVKNNIISGIPESMINGDFSHNLYTHPSYNASPSGTGEVRETDLSAIFTDPDSLDFHLVTGSPAIDAGIDVGYEYDQEGRSRAYDGTPDIGPFEYGAPVGVRERPQVADCGPWTAWLPNPLSWKNAAMLLGPDAVLFSVDGLRIDPARKGRDGIYVMRYGNEVYRITVLGR